jgi:CcmD family protein
MKMLKRWCAAALLVVSCGIPATAQQPEQQGQQPKRQEVFTPIEQLPPTESMPAAPLLITAYAFVMIVLFVYVLSVARRLSAVQQELNRLDATIKQGGRA